MIRFYQLVARSGWHYRRINFAVALGVAAATAVLTGALIVGDSMRGSLRQLAIQRLGKVDDLIVSDGFFAADFAQQLEKLPAFETHYQSAEAAIFFPGGTVEWQQDQPTRASQVTVFGVRTEFWKLAESGFQAQSELSADSVIINQALADHLGLTRDDITRGSAKLTVRIPKQHQLPADSPMSKQDDLIESLVDLTVIEIVSNRSLGGFSLFPSQTDPLNVFLSLDRLQASLEQTVLQHKSNPAQANLILLSGKPNRSGSPTEDAGTELLQQSQPALEDLGLSFKRVTRTFPASAKSDQPDSGQPNFDQTEPDSETIIDYASLSTERLVFEERAAATIEQLWPQAKPVFTYLANEIRLANSDSETSTAIPFSMVTAIDFDESFAPPSQIANRAIPRLADDEIVLVDWAAQDLGAKPGDQIELRYFEPETTHGDQVERSIMLKLVDVARLTTPEKGYVVSRRGSIQPAQFVQRPEITNDPDLTPEVPGVTDAESIERWDLPFETASKIRPQDDEYWNDHRTTPKAYVSLALGQKLWNSRFGQVTSFRLPATDLARQAELVSAATQSSHHFGLQVISIKRRSLEASAGSTPFDVLFLALSMFVIGSALILVVLLFRLSIQHRAAEIGILSAMGWTGPAIRRLWLAEMSVVSIVGAGLGVLLGIGYAALMIWGLTTWWVDAISSPFLQLHLSPLALIVGGLCGWLVSTLTIGWSLHRALKQNTRTLLTGQLEDAAVPSAKSTPTRSVDRLRWATIACGFLGLILAVIAVRLAGEAQAGAFLGAGFLVLSAGLMAVYRWLGGSGTHPAAATTRSNLNLVQLAQMNARRNPLRGTLTIGLVAIASFLIAAVSAFRLAPTEQGTGGFDWVAKSSQPIQVDLSTAEGRAKLLGSDETSDFSSSVYPLRYQSGEDASCNNLYQSSRPQVLGLPGQFIESFDSTSAEAPRFGWAGSLATTEAQQRNPWHLLSSGQSHAGTADDPIPAVIDKNTANYSLKIYQLDTLFEIETERGDRIHFRIVGFLSNSILQGTLMIGEPDFLSAFPQVGGYQYFLIRQDQAAAEATEKKSKLIADAQPAPTATLSLPIAAASVQPELSLSKPQEILQLEDRLRDYGFEARSATLILANFLKVQNTYLSTFQTLGSLGLLLGTFGLAVIQLRTIIERRRELGLLRAVGFSESQLGRLVLLENLLLLGLGLGVGLGAALFTTIPHRWLGNASLPWLELGLMFSMIFVVGVLASFLAAAKLNRLPVLESLRG